MAQDRLRNIQLESETENQREKIDELETQLEEMRVNQANVELGLLRLGIGGFSQIWDFISGGKPQRHAHRISASGIKAAGLRKPSLPKVCVPDFCSCLYSFPISLEQTTNPTQPPTIQPSFR
jgi:hypothetical protein